MGHERIGHLPKSKKWRALVAEVAECGGSADHIPQLARNTLGAVGQRYFRLADDPSVTISFEFLLRLARSSPVVESPVGTVLSAGPLELALALDRELPRDTSLETRAVAHQAAVEALVTWRTQNSVPWGELFANELTGPPLRGIGTGAGFSELARLFFASLTKKYLKYFLEREASAAIPRIQDREAFGRNLDEHIEDISKHAFEAAGITQSYAAGWFNKRRSSVAGPSKAEVRNFLRHQFSKLREALRRDSEE